MHVAISLVNYSQSLSFCVRTCVGSQQSWGKFNNRNEPKLPPEFEEQLPHKNGTFIFKMEASWMNISWKHKRFTGFDQAQEAVASPRKSSVTLKKSGSPIFADCIGPCVPHSLNVQSPAKLSSCYWVLEAGEFWKLQHSSQFNNYNLIVFFCLHFKVIHRADVLPCPTFSPLQKEALHT